MTRLREHLVEHLWVRYRNERRRINWQYPDWRWQVVGDVSTILMSPHPLQSAWCVLCGLWRHGFDKAGR